MASSTIIEDTSNLLDKNKLLDHATNFAFDLQQKIEFHRTFDIVRTVFSIVILLLAIVVFFIFVLMPVIDIYKNWKRLQYQEKKKNRKI